MGDIGSTKEIIAGAFKELVLAQRTSAVPVHEIAERSEVSRKTFYYHFPDKIRLVQWIFRSEIAAALESAYDEKNLVRPFVSRNDLYPDMPFYARIPVGVRFLDESSFFKLFGQYLQTNRFFSRIILQESMGPIIKRGFFELYHQALYGDVLFILGGRELPNGAIEKLAAYYTHAAFSQYFDHLVYSGEGLESLLPSRFKNITHESLSGVIESYFTRNEQEYRFFA